ncbi:MAG TPA: transferrin-binding protein-like solute binding protein [Burkholderiales bacterium]
MKAKAIAAALALSLITACASSGGSGSGEAKAQIEAQPWVCFLIPFLCIIVAFDDSATGSGTQAATLQSAGFANWAELKRDARTEAPGLGLQLAYEASKEGVIRVTGDAMPGGGAVVQYDASGRLVHFGDGTASFGASNGGNLAALGQPGVDRLHGPSGTLALVANPYALGWNYQSFGAWNRQNTAGSGAISVSSFWHATPASAVPTSGSATFTGKSSGFYVSPAGQGSIAAADITVNANFSTRSLGFTTSATTIARDLKAPITAPHLNLSGMFTYSAGTNAFAGTVTNAGGTMTGASKGQFYGPAAQELGGVFNLKSSTSAEAFTGAYGAKRQ